MQYVSIDLETCGLDPEACDILEFAAVVDNLYTQPDIHSLPVFHRYVFKPLYRGEPFALSMHKDIFAKITSWQQGKERNIQVCRPDDIMEEFYYFLREHYVTDKKHMISQPIKVLAAGKNFATFDSRFIAKLPQHQAYPIEFNHRVLDPAMLYLSPEDTNPPGMAECMRRAGIDGPVAHTATEDALAVIRLLRKKFPPKP